MNGKSDNTGFIVVYPEGTGGRKQSQKTWNSGDNCCGAAYEQNVDDVGFISAMIDDLGSKFNIDKKRVYATGYSNGGRMAYRLACELGDRIASIASIAGGTLQGCNPSRPISVLHFHGTADQTRPYEGGTCGSPAIAGETTQGFPCVSVPEELEQWAERDGCDSEPATTYTSGSVTCITYGQCDQNAEVELCTIEGGGHTWPGGAYNPNTELLRRLLGPLTQDINANDRMWEFFREHSLP